ncbi:hypothetical protein E0W68_05400 [Flavobacterium salilacus subsp. salilacus]|uniref:hypothetical protein n=1 Tax=Flavobacterium TaxID=237 RepID=UPI001075268F|nr:MULTISPECIES: hypothetical protein [Flavobacterium]KAF2519208.1 hypothetical protein E0W68_05400 [Flavobacterium salilacus subsp. salilacus]MBE1613388.1 hypothetical protein [Flavobacterium sp. SaA2.13]
MKKTFFAIFVLFLSISCSNESTEQEANQTELTSDYQLKSGGHDLETLFNAMISSQDYIDLESKTQSFTQKMNYNGDIADIDNESKMMSWISTNIHTTSFVDYNEAVNEYGSIVSTAEKVVSANTTFFSEYAQIDHDDTTIFIPWQPESPTNPASNCVKDCWDFYESRVNAFSRILTRQCNEEPENYAELLSNYRSNIHMLKWVRDKCLDNC